LDETQTFGLNHPLHPLRTIRWPVDVSVRCNTLQKRQLPMNRNTRWIIVRPYSHDIRIRVLHAYQHAEESQRQIARRFNVSLSFVRDLIRRYRETGSIAPRKHPGRPNSKIDKDSLDLILALAANDPLLPLSTLCERLAQERHLRISRATMWRTLQKHRPSKAMVSSALHKQTPLLRLQHAGNSSLATTTQQHTRR
jgi:transposase